MVCRIPGAPSVRWPFRPSNRSDGTKDADGPWCRRTGLAFDSLLLYVRVSPPRGPPHPEHGIRNTGQDAHRARSALASPGAGCGHPCPGRSSIRWYRATPRRWQSQDHGAPRRDRLARRPTHRVEGHALQVPGALPLRRAEGTHLRNHGDAEVPPCAALRQPFGTRASRPARKALQ
jgi:hypothetical protein